MPLARAGAKLQNLSRTRAKTLHLLEQQSAAGDAEERSGAAPGHKAGCKARQREANGQTLGAPGDTV